MVISSFGYNVPNVNIPDAITVNTKTKVGTIEQFKQLLAMITVSGIVRVQCRVGTVYMDGAMIANPYEEKDGIECFTISMANAQNPYILSAQIVLEDDGMYVTITITTLT